ncbi:MAG TPA: insulinase family protein, partial [Phycisphaerae bacterium]
IDYILSGGESGRLHRKLVKELELAIRAQSFLVKLEQDGIWGVGAAVQIGQKPEDVEKAIGEQIDLLLKDGVTEKELEKARNQVAAAAIEERQTVAGKAQRLGYAAVVENDLANVNADLERLQGVTAEDVLRVARKYMTEQGRLTIIVRPQLSKVGKFLEGLMGRKGGDEKESKPATTQPESGGRP